MYITREMDVVVKVECGAGGAPKSVVERAVRLKGVSAYDKCFVLVDADLPFECDAELERRMRKKPHLEILTATPCIEGLLLAILDVNFSPSAVTAGECKRIFERRYLPKDRKTYKHSYARIFSRQMIDARRGSVPELDAILRAMGV